MTSVDIIQEVRQNFIDGSYEINANRAFPDVRDGLKSGQRACLWEMYTKGYSSDRPHVKSAKIDGGVAALWWPHGTTAIYETFARMSQPFINNIPEVDFHGSNGNIILGDVIAADRYTEARLSKVVEQGMLCGIKKDCVPMILNFSEDEEWPKVLPAVFPRLLVNGAQGIGVGVANMWLPHNFTETANLILEYIKTGKLNSEEYYPDFPTGGTIINKDDLPKINRTGKGKVIIQANYNIDGKEIDFYEMPYQVYIEPVIEQIKDAIDKDKIHGIKSVFNKSDKKRISLVVECDSKTVVNSVLDQLFTETDLRKQYNANQNGIVSKTPTLLNLQEVIDIYIAHNTTCICREHEYDYRKTIERIEILEGLLKALGNIENIIEIIKNSSSSVEASNLLKKKWSFTDNQTKAILDMKLSRLSGLEQEKLEKEYEEKKKFAEYCKQVINSIDKQRQVLVERLQELVTEFGDERRTKVTQEEIVKISKSKSKKEQIPEDVVVAIDNNGYIKSIPLNNFKTNTDHLNEFKTTTENMILLFSNYGKLYRVRVGSIKQCGSKDKGSAAGSLIKLDQGEKILNAFSMNVNEKRPYMVFFTKNGLVKKSEKKIYISNTQNLNGLNVCSLGKDNYIVGVYESNGDIAIINSNNNMTICFELENVNCTGKASKGVKAIALQDGDYVTKAKVVTLEKWKEIIAQNANLKLQNRGGKGVRG